MILRIVEATVCGPQLLRLTFNEGTRKTVQVSPLLCGPIFEPLHRPDYFAQQLDRVCGTVVWPNGELAPEALHDLMAVEEPTNAEPGAGPERTATRCVVS